MALHRSARTRKRVLWDYCLFPHETESAFIRPFGRLFSYSHVLLWRNMIQVLTCGMRGAARTRLPRGTRSAVLHPVRRQLSTMEKRRSRKWILFQEHSLRAADWDRVSTSTPAPDATRSRRSADRLLPSIHRLRWLQRLE